MSRQHYSSSSRPAYEHYFNGLHRAYDRFWVQPLDVSGWRLRANVNHYNHYESLARMMAYMHTLSLLGTFALYLAAIQLHPFSPL